MFDEKMTEALKRISQIDGVESTAKSHAAVRRYVKQLHRKWEQIFRPKNQNVHKEK